MIKTIMMVVEIGVDLKMTDNMNKIDVIKAFFS